MTEHELLIEVLANSKNMHVVGVTRQIWRHYRMGLKNGTLSETKKYAILTFMGYEVKKDRVWMKKKDVIVK